MFKGIFRIIISYLLILFSLLLSLSLINFTPNDFLFYTSNPNIPPLNNMGILGVWLATAFTTFYGKASWIWVLFSLLIGIRLLTGIKPKELLIKFLSIHYLAFILSILMSLIANSSSFLVGGILGILIKNLLVQILPNIVWTILCIGLFLWGLLVWDIPQKILERLQSLIHKKSDKQILEGVDNIGLDEEYSEEIIIDENPEEREAINFFEGEEEFYGDINPLLDNKINNYESPSFLRSDPSPIDNLEPLYFTKKRLSKAKEPDFLRDTDIDLLSLYCREPNSFYQKIEENSLFDETNVIEYLELDDSEGMNHNGQDLTDIWESLEELDQSTQFTAPLNEIQKETEVLTEEFAKNKHPITKLSFNQGFVIPSDEELSKHKRMNEQENILRETNEDTAELENQYGAVEILVDEKPEEKFEEIIYSSEGQPQKVIQIPNKKHKKAIPVEEKQHSSHFPPVEDYDDRHIILEEFTDELSYKDQIKKEEEELANSLNLSESERLLVEGIDRTNEKQKEKQQILKDKLYQKQQELADQYHKQYYLSEEEEKLITQLEDKETVNEQREFSRKLQKKQQDLAMQYYSNHQDIDYGLDDIFTDIQAEPSDDIGDIFTIQNLENEILELKKNGIINEQNSSEEKLLDNNFLNNFHEQDMDQDIADTSTEILIDSHEEQDSSPNVHHTENQIISPISPPLDEEKDDDTNTSLKDFMILSNDEHDTIDEILPTTFQNNIDTIEVPSAIEMNHIINDFDQELHKPLTRIDLDYDHIQFNPKNDKMELNLNETISLNEEFNHSKDIAPNNLDELVIDPSVGLKDISQIIGVTPHEDIVPEALKENHNPINGLDMLKILEPNNENNNEQDVFMESLNTAIHLKDQKDEDDSEIIQKSDNVVIFDDILSDFQDNSHDTIRNLSQNETPLNEPIHDDNSDELFKEFTIELPEDEVISTPIEMNEEQDSLIEQDTISEILIDVEPEESKTISSFIEEVPEELDYQPILNFEPSQQIDTIIEDNIINVINDDEKSLDEIDRVIDISNQEIISNTLEEPEEIVIQEISQEQEDITGLQEEDAALLPKITTESHLVTPLEYLDDELEPSHIIIENSSDKEMHKDFIFPKVEDLDPNTVHIDEILEEQEIEDTMKMIEDTYESFNINMQVVDYSRGPTITRFELEPPSGLKLRTIFNLQDDLALQAGTSSIRIISPVEGRSCIGIEVPNKIRKPFLLREQIESVLFQNSNAALPLILGVDVGGKEIMSDLATTPHLLIAGTTGSGKSVYVNALIMGLLYKLSAEDLKFIMIDPKMVELELYNGIPHLLAPIITKPEEAMAALEWAVQEMDRRYKILSELSVRNIKEYQDLAKQSDENVYEKLPYIVIIVDEFANLMLRAPKDTEKHISRLASMARAVGMHIVLATQRPSVDVVTGVIKANFPSRIAFRVTSKIDSRTIIDKNGAETLLGRGDMLFMSPNYINAIRMQSPFVSSEDVARVVNTIKKNGTPEYAINFTDLLIEKEENNHENSRIDSSNDPLFDEVLRHTVDNGEISASGIQRRFRVGYNRASRLIETMKNLKIISPPPSAGKGWQVNITKDQVEDFLN